MAVFYGWVAATTSATLSYGVIAVQMVLYGLGMGLTSAPATEAIMGVVSRSRAGVGSAVNDATRLIGGTLGVAVLGSIYASGYGSRLAATTPAGVPGQVAALAHQSVGARLRGGGRPRPTRPSRRSGRRCGSPPPTRSCTASRSPPWWRAGSRRRERSWSPCSSRPSPPSPPSPVPRVASRSRRHSETGSFRAHTEGIARMTGRITRQRDIESLKIAARWPDADKNTMVTLASRLAVDRADAEGYRYFSRPLRRPAGRGAAARPGRVLPGPARPQTRHWRRRASGALARLDRAASADLGLPQYFRGLALTALPPDRGRAEQAIADLEFVLAVRDLFPAMLLRGAFAGLARAHAVLGHDRAGGRRRAQVRARPRSGRDAS